MAPKRSITFGPQPLDGGGIAQERIVGVDNERRSYAPVRS